MILKPLQHISMLLVSMLFCYDCIYADYIRQWEMSHFKWYDVESVSPSDSVLVMISITMTHIHMEIYMLL